MLDFDGQFSSGRSARVVATQGVERTEEQRRRDVYDSHRHRAFGIAYYMTGNEVEAEEVLTETFVTVFSEAEEPNASRVDAALMGALKKRFPLEAIAAAPALAAHSGMGGRNVRRTELEEALRELSPTDRLLFLLRDVEGYPVEKIAGLLDLPAAEVQRALFSVRIRLRNLLAEMAGQREAA